MQFIKCSSIYLFKTIFAVLQERKHVISVFFLFFKTTIIIGHEPPLKHVCRDFRGTPQRVLRFGALLSFFIWISGYPSFYASCEVKFSARMHRRWSFSEGVFRDIAKCNCCFSWVAASGARALHSQQTAESRNMLSINRHRWNAFIQRTDTHMQCPITVHLTEC